MLKTVKLTAMKNEVFISADSNEEFTPVGVREIQQNFFIGVNEKIERNWLYLKPLLAKTFAVGFDDLFVYWSITTRNHFCAKIQSAKIFTSAGENCLKGGIGIGPHKPDPPFWI